MTSTSGKALSVKKSSANMGWMGKAGVGCFFVLFPVLFTGAGAAVLWFTVIHPAINSFRAGSWAETPCTILTSEVGRHRGDDGDTYSIDITYAYEYDGKQFEGDRYSFTTGSSSGRAGKEKVVQQYPPRSQARCYVNPADPAESVINRSWQKDMLWGLLGLPFLFVGLGVGYAMLHSGLSKSKPAKSLEAKEPAERAGMTSGSTRIVTVSDSDYDTEDLVEEPGPITLKSESTPLGSFIGLTVFALIWNGVLSIFLYQRLGDWMQGKWQWFPELILLPFLAIGLLIIFGAISAFLALFNPVPLLTLHRQFLPLGSTGVVSWEFQGSTRSLRGLKLSLKGVEESRYTRGTDTHTDTHTFHEETIFETSDPEEIGYGHTQITIPHDSMHSFFGGNNKIKWQLQLQGEIALWPDVSATFPVRVVPHE